MKPPWSTAFWFRIDNSKPPRGNGIIASYQGIDIFLTPDNHAIGLGIGNSKYLGPALADISRWMHYVLTNDGTTVILYLNGQKMIEVCSGKVVFTASGFLTEPSKTTPPIPSTTADLSNWVEKRESMFKIKCATSAQYRLLTAEEQIQGLASRMDALKDLLQGYNSGKKYYLADILANMRSLVVYKQKSQTYDPLLLRVAALKRSELPVYVIPRLPEIQQSVEPMQQYIAVENFASVEPRVPHTEKVDFQDFLETDSLSYEGQNISPLALIEMVSTTQSTAHFDQRVCRITDALNDTPSIGGHNTLEMFVIGLANLVLELGHVVLSS